MKYGKGSKGLILAVLLVLLLATGCFLFPSSGFHNVLRINGYVRSSTDSTAVEGAEILVLEATVSLVKDTAYSDSLGYFYCSWSSLTDENTGDYREWIVVVHDIDGIQNGVFTAKDTTLIEEDPMHNSETEWELDFYVDLQ